MSLGNYEVTPSDEQIDAVLNDTAAAIDEGVMRYPGMSYEQGVRDAIMWVVGETDEVPYEPDAD